MFCTVDPVPDQSCTFCGKSKHTAECCRAHKKAEKKARAQESGAARSNALNPSTTTTRQTWGPPTSASGTTGSHSQGQQPTQVVPPPTIGERLQQLASSTDGVTVSSPSGGTPPLAYMEGDRMDPGRAYSTAGSAHSIPTSAPGMYDYTNGGGTQSTSSNSSLESHMSQLSKTMLQLAQTNQVMANHQCQNHQAMVDVQKQQTEAFNALAAATEQRKYDNLFAMIPKFDGTNKEDCAIWLSQVDQLVTSTGRDLQMELLN